MAAREEELEQILLDELGFAGREELKSGDDIPWPTSLAIPDIDSAFFLNNLPIAYFSRLSELDEERIIRLHKRVWSQSKAPLLFVTLPHEIRVYNGYHRPSNSEDATERLLQHLGDLTDLLSAQQRIKSILVDENHYERIYLETGEFWNTDEGRRIDYQTRADKQLVDSMGQMRKSLTGAGLSNHVAYTLLGRSIFIRYLEDRKVLSNEWIVQATNGMARTYREALNVGHTITYQLFGALSQRFNGELFPVEPDEEYVTEGHLRILLNFLNRTDLKTGQLSLWHYDFAYIPIELISHIYDTFIEDQRQSGAYYTPLPLADFILEETLGDDVIRSDMTVLDPACGSGVFLVGAFRRLVQAWQRENRRAPRPDDLRQILRHSIYGIDTKREAVRIAAFSLYLEILNHMTNKQIQDESFQFPTLLRQNLLNSDFFDKKVDEHFAIQRFDRIVGNLPWGSGTLSDQADVWLKTNSYIVGDKQAAPAFMLRAPHFISESSEIAFLAPAKSTLFVTSGPHRAFRETFFKAFHVRAVVNFSALVYELFPGAISPASAFFYSLCPPILEAKMVYAIPKPSPLSQRLKAIVLDTTEIKFLSREELLEHPYLWKVAQWGTPRDAVLIKKLTALPSLKEHAQELGLRIDQGYQDYKNRGKPRPAEWLTGKEMLPTNKMKAYWVDDSSFRKIEQDVFYYPGSPELFKSPLALIHQSQCTAAYSSSDVAYHHTITGVTGSKEDEWLLQWLVSYVNSPLAQYYHFLTSTRWAVERGNIIQAEYEAMPFLVPERDDPRLQKILEYMTQIRDLFEKKSAFYKADDAAGLKELEDAIHKLVYEIYGLHPIEQQLVEDMLTYGVGFFKWAKRKTRRPGGAKPVRAPSADMLTQYAGIFASTASSLLRVKNQTLNAVVYKNGAPLTVVTFELVPQEEKQSVRIADSHDAMRTQLRKLDQFLIEQKTPSMYMRRHVRVYDGKTVSLVRPSEQRFWTQSQARVDADAFLAELSSF